MKPDRWLEIIILFTLLTVVAILIIPGDSPFFPLRYLLGFVFVVFLPGYCLVSVLFVGPDRIDPVETAVLSVALSFGIAGLVGLFLGLSPIGIGFESSVLSLVTITLVLAAVAFLRKRRLSEKIQPQVIA